MGSSCRKLSLLTTDTVLLNMQLLKVLFSIFLVVNCHIINNLNNGWNNMAGNNMLGLGNNMLGLGNNMMGTNVLGIGNNMWNNLWGNNMMTRQLLSGRFVMRLQLGDSMFMDRYMAVWGVEEEMVDQMKS